MAGPCPAPLDGKELWSPLLCVRTRRAALTGAGLILSCSKGAWPSVPAAWGIGRWQLGDLRPTLPPWLPGELPLSLAACTNQWDVVSYLLENPTQPASLQATDSLGNTALHALVTIADNSAENSALVIRMYDRLLQAGARLCPSVQLEDIPNQQGLTPLKLAAKEGKIEVSDQPPPTPHLSQQQPDTP